MDRRTALKGLGFAAAASTGLVLATGAPAFAYDAHNNINGVPTYYPGISGPYTQYYDSTFYSSLGLWLNYYTGWQAPGFGIPTAIGTLGSYVQKPGPHGVARAFDLTYIDTPGGRVFNARYVDWSNWTGSAFTDSRRRYWAIAALSHCYFTNVITYPFDNDHHDHMHIDDDISRTEGIKFVSSRRAQNYMVQAACSYIWNIPTAVDGGWGPQTDTNSRTVLSWLGRTGGLLDSPYGNWNAFLNYSFRRGLGTY